MILISWMVLTAVGGAGLLLDGNCMGRTCSLRGGADID